MTDRELDGALERVLRGIAEVRPPEGLEEGVMAAVASVERGKSGESRRAGRGWWMWAPVCAAVLLAAAVGGWRLVRGRAGGQRAAVVGRVVSQGSGGAVRHESVVAVRSGEGAVVARPRVNAAGGQGRSRLERERGSGTAVAESFPAPEEPLSEQERLLLKLAHRGEAVEVAGLSRAEQGRQEERAEFERFFEPRPAPPLQPAVKEAGGEAGAGVQARAGEAVPAEGNRGRAAEGATGAAPRTTTNGSKGEQR